MNVLHGKFHCELLFSSTPGFDKVPKKEQNSSQNGYNNL